MPGGMEEAGNHPSHVPLSKRYQSPDFHMIASKFLRQLAVLAVVSWFGVFNAGSSLGQTASVQIIHNSADPALQWLDLYLDNTLVADSLLFRIATTYLEVPAGSGIEAGLAPPPARRPTQSGHLWAATPV